MHHISPNNLKSTIALASILVAISTTSAVRGATITLVSDSFTAADGTALTAHTPDTNVPGGSYFVASQGGTPSITGNAASLDTNASAFISIASHGTYTKPADFTISGDLTLGSIQNDNPAIFPTGFTFVRGVGLGFVSSHDTSFDGPSGDFTGLVLSPTGSLALEVSGNGFVQISALDSVAYDPSDFHGVAFNPLTAYDLTYSINTVTGAIYGVTLSDTNGSESYNFSTSAFTNSATTDAGFIVSAGNGGGAGTVDNFSVTTPEPSTWALLTAGLFGLFGWQRCRRNA